MQNLERHYEPNHRLVSAYGLHAFNCGYAAPGERADFRTLQQALVWRLLEDVEIGHGSTVLDVGCGIGGPARWIWERYHPARLIGLDFTAGNVSVAEASWNGYARRPQFLQGDAQHLPIAAGTVDVVVSLESALHYPDKRAFLWSCRRVLRPGGVLCLGDITAARRGVGAFVSACNYLPGSLSAGAHLWGSAVYHRAFGEAGLDLVRHESAAPAVAKALSHGLEEIGARGWKASKGCRSRIGYLFGLSLLLKSGVLGYDLFLLRRT